MTRRPLIGILGWLVVAAAGWMPAHDPPSQTLAVERLHRPLGWGRQPGGRRPRAGLRSRHHHPQQRLDAPLGDLASYAPYLTGSPATEASRYDLVLAPATLREMWQPVVAHDANGPDAGFAGLAFQGYRVGDRTVIGHTGDQAGFRSMRYFDPQTRRAVVAVVNTSNAARPDSDAGWETLEALARALTTTTMR